MRFGNGAAAVRRDEHVIGVVVVAAGIRAGEWQVARAIERRGAAMTDEDWAAHAFSADAAPLCALTSAIIASQAGTSSNRPSQ